MRSREVQGLDPALGWSAGAHARPGRESSVPDGLELSVARAAR